MRQHHPRVFLFLILTFTDPLCKDFCTTYISKCSWTLIYAFTSIEFFSLCLLGNILPRLLVQILFVCLSFYLNLTSDLKKNCKKNTKSLCSLHLNFPCQHFTLLICFIPCSLWVHFFFFPDLFWSQLQGWWLLPLNNLEYIS